MKLTNEFQSIRDWAEDRGIYNRGDVKTQFVKLLEEVGELGKYILKNNESEVKDAIGDIVVVLTNLTEFCNYEIKGFNQTKNTSHTIEDCINGAYNVIKNRQGKMENGTFVKNGI